MRVIESPVDGELVQAANDDELVRALSDHLAEEHDMEVDEEELTELVEAEAYEATDA